MTDVGVITDKEILTRRHSDFAPHPTLPEYTALPGCPILGGRDATHVYPTLSPFPYRLIKLNGQLKILRPTHRLAGMRHLFYCTRTSMGGGVDMTGADGRPIWQLIYANVPEPCQLGTKVDGR